MVHQNPADETLDKENRPQSDAELRAKLPPQVKEQPDPFLQMSTGGRMGAAGVALFALAAVVVLSVVLYGLNGRNSGPEATAPAASNAAAAPATGSAAAPTPTAQQKGPGGNP